MERNHPFVEDDPIVLKVVALILKRAGYAVLSANSAAEAAEFVSSLPGVIHLLISDVQMPDICRALTSSSS